LHNVDIQMKLISEESKHADKIEKNFAIPPIAANGEMSRFF